MATFVDSFNDLKELGIECEDSDSLTETFNKAANHLQTLLPKVDNQVLLDLYGYYKQGTQGCCNTSKPGWFDMRAKAKWEAWKKLGNMSQNMAKAVYIDTIKNLDPDFNPSSVKECWVSVSTLHDQSEPQIGSKNIIDYVRENDCVEVTKILESSKDEGVNRIDNEGLGLVHWAADRGFCEVLKILIDFGADVNLQDSDGQTALHYAASCGHGDCIKLLLENGAKLDVIANDGTHPKDVAADETVKELLTK